MKLEDFTHGPLLFGAIGVGAALLVLMVCCCCRRQRGEKDDQSLCLTPNHTEPNPKHHYALDVDAVLLTSPAAISAQPAQLLPRKSLADTEIDYSAMPTSPAQPTSPVQAPRSSMGRRDVEQLPSTSRYSFSQPRKSSDERRETDRLSTASYSPPSRRNSTVIENDRLSTASTSPPSRKNSNLKESTDRPKPLIVSVAVQLQTPGLELGDFEMMPTSPVQPASRRQRQSQRKKETELAIPTSPVLHHSSVGVHAGLSPTDMEWYTTMATSPSSSHAMEMDATTTPPAVTAPICYTPKRKKSVTFDMPDDETNAKPPSRPATPRSILTTSSRFTPSQPTPVPVPADPFALAEDVVVVASRLPFETIKTETLLSKDGFGEVYRGTYRNSVVTIKRLLPDARRDVIKIQSMLKEVQLMAAMDHAHIVQFVGVAWDAFSDICVVTEYMDGGDLRSALDHSNELGRPLGFDKQKATIALHVAHALTYLHSLQKTVLYRDIKSTNVLLNKDHTLAKLANCSGLKEWQDGTMTVGVGSGLWMAPEVMTGDQYDDKADVFSFGILLSELDTYLLPYADFTTADTGDVDSQLALTTTTVLLHRILAGQATVTFSKDLRADVRALGEACVRLDPKQRPTSAQVLYELQKIERTMESEISIVL